ncbi:MAG: C40 family peptidase [Verrucomicrobiaceae bacterium]|nr:C40 family peptidase [Verrucomicrobiaceae bacterium]
MIARFFLVLLSLAGSLLAQDGYKSPYAVKFSFQEEELIGDLLKGPRSDWKDYATVPYSQWQDPANQRRWGYWGPSIKHLSPPTGLAKKSPQWSRERVIATAMRYIGYSYQHHHVPEWEPPADWPRDPDQKTPVGKGVDCSNFTGFVYNLALGIFPSTGIKQQSEMTEAAGPGAGRSVAVKRIELPKSYEDFPKVLQTGDLLFVKSNKGNVSHVVLWVGKIGESPDGMPLILDSTGSGAKDASGVTIPDGVHLRAFKRSVWYFTQASHVLRIIPEDP